ncbi:hypothetical protein BHE74_00038758 [Ensete ventricosum]|nr:hypothetical protein GW17_00036976 [Ensete ventricosum]RWW54649.1 hypothetical protein BHE74_00038758 [Ensete ventricosum]
MPTWLWFRRGSVYNSDADVTAKLAWALMDWAGPLSALSFFSLPPSPWKGGFLELTVNYEEGPCRFPEVQVGAWSVLAITFREFSGGACSAT